MFVHREGHICEDKVQKWFEEEENLLSSQGQDFETIPSEVRLPKISIRVAFLS